MPEPTNASGGTRPAHRIGATARSGDRRGREPEMAVGDGRRNRKATDVVVDEASGMFGHRTSMLDFSPATSSASARSARSSR